MRVNTRHINSARGTSSNVYEDVPLVEFMYLVFTRMPGESYRRRLGSLLLYLCCVFRALINSLVLLILSVTPFEKNDDFGSRLGVLSSHIISSSITEGK